MSFVGGQYVDILGEVETLARTPFSELQAPYGSIRLVSPEDLLVERVLISVYPQPHEPADRCARKLIAVAVSGHLEVDWREARRLAECPGYAILPELTRLVGEVAHELGKAQPLRFLKAGPSAGKTGWRAAVPGVKRATASLPK